VETVDALGIASEPLPPQPVRPNHPLSAVLGAVRLPLAGAYRPWARLVRRPDGRLAWIVRLWQVDRVVVHLVETETLRTFAARAGLGGLALEIEELVARAEARP
jgi:hypothetical protein